MSEAQRKSDGIVTKCVFVGVFGDEKVAEIGHPTHNSAMEAFAKALLVGLSFNVTRAETKQEAVN